MANTDLETQKAPKRANNGRIEADLATETLPRPFGRYMLLKRIAKGGMGEVLLATTMGIEGAERPVIVKIIRREHKRDPNFYARFLDETRVQAQLSHSGVAQVLDAAIDDATGEPYAVVEYVEGKSLGELRSRAVQVGHRLGWADAVALAHLVAEGLAHVHERKDPSGKPLAIVHRDLSPQNVMVGFSGEVKIIDFGTARGQNRRCHTVAGVVFAKPGYVAPEVANGDSGDARVDLYALGVMLWELVVGRRFLQGDAQVHLAKVARNEMALPPIAKDTGAPADLDRVIAKLTAHDRDARYLAARAAATDLARLLGSAEPLPTGERGVRQRVAHLMHVLFPGEPAASRQELARLIVTARAERASDVRSAPKADAKSAPPVSPPPAPEKPANDTGPYRIVRELGRGATATVFEAEHTLRNKRVALKVMNAEHAGSLRTVERFKSDMRALARVPHPNLVGIEEVGTLPDGRAFCAMELLAGETLEAFLGRERGTDYREALKISADLLAALEAAHGAGIVHRDVQPANVFLIEGGGVKLIDFGLPGDRKTSKKGLDPEPQRRSAQTPGGPLVIFGTPAYMAPEQATGNGATADARADIYAVGAVLYELLTATVPFEGASPVATLDRKQRETPENPRVRAPERGIPEAVASIVMKALARDPAGRFASAADMRAAVLAASQTERPRRGRRIGAVVATAAAMLALAGGLWARSHDGAQRISSWLGRPAAADIAKEPAPADADLDEVPLGELGEAPLVAPTELKPEPAILEEKPSIQGNSEDIANTDPALADPTEEELAAAPDDVIQAHAEGETNGAQAAPAVAGSEPTPKAHRPRPKKPTKSAPKKATPKPAPAKETKAAKETKDAKAASDKAAAPAHDDPKATPKKTQLAPKDGEDEAGRRKKKKVRLAKAK